MYADRKVGPGRLNPGSLGVAVGVNAGLVAALLYAGPTFGPVKPKPPLTVVNVLPEVIPPPEKPPEPMRRTDIPPPPERIDRSDPPPLERPIIAPAWTDPGPATSFGSENGVAGGVGEATAVVDPPKPPPPVLVGARVDPRYADALQPPYPPGERRAGNEGRVVVRVLVGADGRVKQVEPVSATSDAFFRATQDQALRRWRFRPATRDGVAVESWQTMSLKFVLED